MSFPATATAPACPRARRPPCLAAGLLALAAALVPGQGPAEERASEEAAGAPLALSLAEAVRRAEETNESVAIARAAFDRAEAERRIARSRRWPQLFATASYTRTLASEFEEVFRGPPDGAGEGTDGAGGTGPELDGTLEDLPFGREHAFRAGLSLTWELWSGGQIGAGVAAADAAVESVRLALDAERARAILDAVRAYYDAVLAERLLAIARESLAQAERALELSRAERAAGAKPEFELLRARVARDNLLPEVARRRTARDLAVLRLKELLELPADAELLLVSDLEEERLGELEEAVPEVANVAADPGAVEPERRVAVREAALAVEAREAALDAARGQRWPSLALTSDYGLVQYPPDPWPTLDDWRDNWTVGVGLALPLFTGFRIDGTVRAARAELADARARHRRTVEGARLDDETARRELAAATATFAATGSTVAEATRAYEIAEVRYREGISTQLELSDARLQLQQASANRALAARELQVARVRVALLPRLPLDGGAPVPTAVPIAVPATATPAGASFVPGTGVVGRPGPVR